MIEAITGMKAGEDYEAIKLAWGAASQAFEDGKFDLFMRSGTVGSAAVDQFGSAKKFRMLSIRILFFQQTHGRNILQFRVVPPMS